MLIATWNVNSIRQRLAHLLRWLDEARPDIVCLQELKCLDEAFPRLEVEAAGYHVETHGQKTFNGVAILSRRRPDEVMRGLEGDDADSHARYMEAIFSTENGVVRAASIYLPNGNPPQTEKYPYKLGFMERLRRRAVALLRLEEPLVLAGDYNVIPEPIDARDPAAWVSDALFLPQTRAAFRRPSRLRPGSRALQLLGLSGRRLPEEQRHPHRSSLAVAPGRRQACFLPHR
jgi:exodeoxyribonuclease-3